MKVNFKVAFPKEKNDLLLLKEVLSKGETGPRTWGLDLLWLV